LLMKLKWNCVINHGNNHGALWYQCVNSACSVLLLLVRKIEVYHTRPVCVNFVLVLLELNGPCTKDLNKQQRIAFCKLLISSSVCSVQSLTVLLSSRLRSWSWDLWRPKSCGLGTWGLGLEELVSSVFETDQ